MTPTIRMARRGSSRGLKRRRESGEHTRPAVPSHPRGVRAERMRLPIRRRVRLPAAKRKQSEGDEEGSMQTTRIPPQEEIASSALVTSSIDPLRCFLRRSANPQGAVIRSRSLSSFKPTERKTLNSSGQAVRCRLRAASFRGFRRDRARRIFRLRRHICSSSKYDILTFI